MRTALAVVMLLGGLILTGCRHVEPLSQPDGVVAEGTGHLTLSWSAQADDAIAGHGIYVGTQPGEYTRFIQIPRMTTYRLTGLTVGTRYYVAVTAINHHGHESALSQEVSQVAKP